MKTGLLHFMDVGEFTPEDKEPLQGALSQDSVRRAMREVLLEADAMDRLTGVDLATDEGQNEALIRQGMVRGLYRAVELLVELQEKENDDG